MGIYSKINEHKMINKKDLIEIFDGMLKKYNLYEKKNNVSFSSEDGLYFMYLPFNQKFCVSNNYKLLTIRPILTDSLIKITTKKNKYNNFLIDNFNLEILEPVFHEVRHKEQDVNLIKSEEDYNFLINQSLEAMTYSEKFYQLNHPRFLSEHDANLSAMMTLLCDIEDGKIEICKEAIYFYNTNIAYYILRSRGYDLSNKELKKKGIFKSPLHMLYFQTKSLYLKKELKKCEFDKICCHIKKLRINNKTEYDRIISGDNVSEETINELFLIATGKIKVKDIFKYFEEKELDKNNSDYIKKLLLK